ncbi:hypothetical protein QJS64_09965 [Paraclostridium bifermentans]|uniref:HEPN domain-containing protein n=1 Tax=Paraclostridium bifermentans TaxID=1490 RepID=A0ABY8R0Y7_PARBF|nr:hypothetical protein QJS64_09965 [Paraclostridium bifermentans]
MSNNYEKAIDFLENDESTDAKKYFLKAYEEGFKKSLYYLRKIRKEEHECKKLVKNLTYDKIKSKLGYVVEIPTHFTKLNTIDDKCFDTITMEKDEDFDFYNIKTHGFLIEIPDGCIDLVSVDSVIKNMSNIDEVRNYKNEKISGKIIVSKSIQGTINYTLITSVNKGIYEFKIDVDEFLVDEYRDVIDSIFDSFYISED